MKVNSPLRWWLIEKASFARCWLGEKREQFARWLICKVAHRQYWRRTPVYHCWDFWCTKCQRRWTVYD